MRHSRSPTSSRQAPINELSLTQFLDRLSRCHQGARGSDLMVAEIQERSGYARTLGPPP
jgi:hypothetical protein